MPPVRLRQVLVFILVGLVVPACSTSNLILKNRVPLEKQHPYDGMLKNMDYQLSYRYVFHPGDPSEADRIVFSGKIMPRRGLDTFRLRLHMLDGAGNVLVSHVLYAPGAGQGAARTTINRTLTVPAGTEAIAFSHFSQENIRFGRSTQKDVRIPLWGHACRFQWISASA
jgi:hypothetical protein